MLLIVALVLVNLPLRAAGVRHRSSAWLLGWLLAIGRQTGILEQ
ncbi:hypothetical protein [Micromonospora sp. RTP1Z1]|nr:hypothetical protein [Micromonospora sp. RTP1Z1]